VGQFTHNGVVYEELPNGKVRPVAYANPLAGATPVGGADPMKPLQVQGAQMGLQRDQVALQQAPLEMRGKELGNQKTAQEIGLDKFKTVVDLKKTYDKDERVQTYRDAIPQVAGAMDAPNTPQGDLSVVYAFAKVMDPASAVRGEEMDMARGSSPIAAQIQSYLGLLNSGKRLPPETRRGLIDAMRTKAQQYEAAYASARDEFQGVAKQGGFDAAAVIGEHDGANFRDIERRFSGQKKFANPQEFNTILSEMIEQGKPVAEIRQTLKDYGSTIPPYQEKILDQYEAARVSGGNPQVRVDTMEGPSVGMGLAKGFKGAWDRAAVGAQDAFNALPFVPDSNSASQAQQATQQAFQGVNTDPTAEMFGRLGGATLFSAPIRNPWAAGAAGNLLMTDSTGMEAVKDAGVGAVGGKVADVALRGGAQLIAPMLDKSVGNLAREGATLTPGRFFPQLKKTEDLARSYPVIGSKIDDALEGAERSVARIPPNRALGRIGQSLPEDVPAGHEAAKYTGDTIGNFYEQNLAGRSVGIDPTLVTRFNYMGQRSGLRPQELEELNGIVQREVGGLFSNGQGKASARDWKRLDSKLGSMASKFSASPDDPFKVQLGEQVGFVQDQMRHLMRRQNPDVAKNLRAADEAWADFVPYQRATSMSLEDGIPTPGQYRSAVRQNDNSLRKGATARGEARMQDFAIDASKVIPAERGNSGSADRLNLASLKAWGLGAAASPLYSDLALSAINKLAKRDPDKASKAIADLMRLPHTRGMFGAIPYYGGVNSGSGY
jgi:uncharacterized membrane protein